MYWTKSEDELLPPEGGPADVGYKALAGPVSPEEAERRRSEDVGQSARIALWIAGHKIKKEPPC